MTQSDKAKAAAEAAAARPRIDPRTVNGWNVDADTSNDPTWPMRDRAGDDSAGLDWARPPLQAVDVEILQSVEHERQPAVVGTAVPPSGVSGSLRRAAFRYSESQWGHWLLLMMADRANAIEGVIGDLARGRAPNPLAEMGLVSRERAPRAAAMTLAASLLAAGLAVWVIRRRR
jgi:hypothetical protein